MSISSKHRSATCGGARDFGGRHEQTQGSLRNSCRRVLRGAGRTLTVQRVSNFALQGLTAEQEIGQPQREQDCAAQSTREFERDREQGQGGTPRLRARGSLHGRESLAGPHGRRESLRGPAAVSVLARARSARYQGGAIARSTAMARTIGFFALVFVFGLHSGGGGMCTAIVSFMVVDIVRSTPAVSASGRVGERQPASNSNRRTGIRAESKGH